MNKKWVKIPELLFFQEGPGVRNTQYTNTGVKLLNVANLVDGKIDLSTSNRYISEEEAYGKYKHFLCDDGDFVIASSGIQVDYVDKKMGFVDSSLLPLCMNTSTIRFKVLNQNELKIKYFMYYLKSQHFKRQLIRFITGSAQLNYGPSHLKQMYMPHVDIKIQDEIINNLDKVQKIIETTQKELYLLDNLIKARFVEMFGDPSLNSRGYHIKHLSEIAEYWNGLTYKPEDVVNNGTIVLRSSNIQNAQLDFEDIVRVNCPISEKKYVQENDILMCSRNGSARLVGKVALIKNVKEPMSFGAFMMIIRSKYYPYLMTYFQMPAFRTQITTGATTTINQITGKMLDEIILPVPRLSELDNYLNFVQQVDKSKFVVQQALNRAQLLFDCLMQKYFE